jgi:3,4-dihydroxy 2-butanone 4-phosphate synthase/GTP cyclohydrolase II
MAKNARGLICLCLTKERADYLNLEPMTKNNTSVHQTAFTISIEAKYGITTGISATDRSTTIKVAIEGSVNDIVSPGHIFPLIARDGGVLEREGHTEGSIDLMKIAELKPYSVICEIMNDDGTMARLDNLKDFAKKHSLKIITIDQIIEHRRSNITFFAETKLPSIYTSEPFAVKSYGEHLILSIPFHDIPYVRIHSECLTGDIFGSMKCDCGQQLKASISKISKYGGIIIYLKTHEGRGIGLKNKIKAYQLQDEGKDTVEANIDLGFKADERSFRDAVNILKTLKIFHVKLLTNNPNKIKELEDANIKVERIKLDILPYKDSQNYINTKIQKLGHIV